MSGTRKTVTPVLTRGHSHMVEDIDTVQGTLIANAANAASTAPTAEEYNALVAKFNAVLVILKDNFLMKTA